MSVLVDSSVILDLLTNNREWAEWAEDQLAKAERSQELWINDIIWAECSGAFSRIEEFSSVIGKMRLVRKPIPEEALFLAAKAFIRYRKAGGQKFSPLPDFFIGAHAAVLGIPILTRDPRRILYHFPTVKVICPE